MRSKLTTKIPKAKIPKLERIDSTEKVVEQLNCNSNRLSSSIKNVTIEPITVTINTSSKVEEEKSEKKEDTETVESFDPTKCILYEEFKSLQNNLQERFLVKQYEIHGSIASIARSMGMKPVTLHWYISHHGLSDCIKDCIKNKKQTSIVIEKEDLSIDDIIKKGALDFDNDLSSKTKNNFIKFIYNKFDGIPMYCIASILRIPYNKMRSIFKENNINHELNHIDSFIKNDNGKFFLQNILKIDSNKDRMSILQFKALSSEEKRKFIDNLANKYPGIGYCCIAESLFCDGSSLKDMLKLDDIHAIKGEWKCKRNLDCRDRFYDENIFADRSVAINLYLEMNGYTQEQIDMKIKNIDIANSDINNEELSRLKKKEKERLDQFHIDEEDTENIEPFKEENIENKKEDTDMPIMTKEKLNEALVTKLEESPSFTMDEIVKICGDDNANKTFAKDLKLVRKSYTADFTCKVGEIDMATIIDGKFEFNAEVRVHIERI